MNRRKDKVVIIRFLSPHKKAQKQKLIKYFSDLCLTADWQTPPTNPLKQAVLKLIQIKNGVEFMAREHEWNTIRYVSVHDFMHQGSL